MSVKDARSLSRSAQVELRKRAVAAHVQGGLTQREVAKAFGVSTVIVCNWVKSYRESGETGLDARRKGPKKGSGALLSEKQAAEIRNLIMDKCPEQLKLPFALWTRDAVRDLISRRFGIRVAVRTMGDYLRAWGFTPQKPVRIAYEKNNQAVQEWLATTYPTIAKRAKQEKAII